MKIIQKGQEPHSLTQHRCTQHADYDNYAHKDELRASLVEEQGHICCYCMQRVRPQVGSMKIEHWHCRHNYPIEQLNYWNLLGSCMGNEGEPLKEQHCDTRKGSNDLSRNPANLSHRIEDFIHYLGNGRVESHDKQIDDELNDVLNLNLKFLKNNRKAVIDSFTKSLPPGTLDRRALERKLNKWNGDGGGMVREYCGIVTYWLRKRLK